MDKTRKQYDSRGQKLVRIHEDHEPIPGDIEARLTKPKQAQELFQVFVEERGKKEAVPISPKMLQQSCEAILASVNKSIIDGVRRDWGNAFIARAA